MNGDKVYGESGDHIHGHFHVDGMQLAVYLAQDCPHHAV